MSNVSEAEIEKFKRYASRWWDPEGDLWTLHAINPLRLSFVDSHVNVAQLRVLDVGCGGGILSEALSKRGADVVGIDLSPELIETAKMHALETSSSAEYMVTSVEALEEQEQGKFDVVTCMEMLEHVPDPYEIIRACAQLVKPNGWLFFSTLNRNPKSFVQGILGAEYVLKLVPRGTHSYSQFIKPSELVGWCRDFNLQPKQLQGLSYNLINKSFFLTPNIDVNYLLSLQKTI